MAANSAGVISNTSRRLARQQHRGLPVPVDDDGVLVRDVLDHVVVQDARPQLVRRLAHRSRRGSPDLPAGRRRATSACTSSTPNWRSTNRMPGSTSGTDVSARSVTRSIARPGATSTISACWPGVRRVAASPRRRAEVRGELRLQVLEQQVDAQLGRRRDAGRPPGSRVAGDVKFLPSSACGRGMTWTLTELADRRRRLGAGLGGGLDRADVTDDGHGHEAVADLLAADDGRRWPP